MPEMELIKTKVDAKTLTGGFHRRMALLRLLYLGDLLANSEVSQDKIMSDLRNSFRTALYSKMMARKDLVAHVGLVQR